jgi:predicted NUDIX family NTP pyrophosphohydrolase
MPRRSAGLLMYRRSGGALEVLLVHPGGPFWMKKDAGAWSIPKGEYEGGEEALAAAAREFQEETGLVARGPYTPLTPIRQQGGKVVEAWAFEGDCDAESLKSTTFSLEWPRGSGRRQEFPEVDRAGWFGLDEARRKILPAQAALLDELASKTP